MTTSSRLISPTRRSSEDNPLKMFGWNNAHWASDPLWSNPGDGSLASSWRDSSVNAYNLTAAGSARPTYRESSSAMNNRPILEFRNDDVMSVVYSGSLTQPTSLVGIARFNNAAVGANLVNGDDTTHRNAIYISNPGLTFNLFAPNDVTGPAADTTKHLFVGIPNGASSKLYVDWGTAFTGNAGAEVLDGFKLAQNAAGTVFSDVDIAFVGVYVGDITTHPNWTIFLRWAQEYYGLPRMVI